MFDLVSTIVILTLADQLASKCAFAGTRTETVAYYCPVILVDRDENMHKVTRGLPRIIVNRVVSARISNCSP